MKIKTTLVLFATAILSAFAQNTNQSPENNSKLLDFVAAKKQELAQKHYAKDLSKTLDMSQIGFSNATFTNQSQDSIQVIGNIEGASWGTLDRFDADELVYYTADWANNTFELTIYDDSFTSVGQFEIDTPTSANQVQILNYISSNFFANANGEVILVFIQYFEHNIIHPDNRRLEVWAVDQAGDILHKFDGHAMWTRIDDQGNKRIISFGEDMDTGDMFVNVFSETDDFDTPITHTIDEEKVLYYLGAPFAFMTIDGEEKLVVSHYESLFMDNMTMEVFEDNHLEINIMDLDLNIEKTMLLDIEPGFQNLGMFVTPMVHFGAFYSDNRYDITKDVFNSDNNLEVLYGIHYYDMMMDEEWTTFRVSSENGTIIHDLNEYIVEVNYDINEIAGHDNQIGFLYGDEVGEISKIGFFDIESWNMAATFDAIQLSQHGEDQLSDKYNRIPAGNTYHYLIGIGAPDYIGDDAFGVINEYTISGDLHKRHRFYLDEDFELFTPLLTSELLKPNRFSIDNDLHFFYVYLQKDTNGVIFNNLVIAKDETNILLELKGNTTRGNINGAGLAMNTDKSDLDMLFVQYDGGSELSVDFYSLPLDAYLSVEDFERNLDVKLYPNPTSDKVFVESDKNLKQVTIYNIVGKKMALYPANTSTMELDLSSLDAGIYLVELISDNQAKQVIKLIKK